MRPSMNAICRVKRIVSKSAREPHSREASLASATAWLDQPSANFCALGSVFRGRSLEPVAWFSPVMLEAQR